MVESSKKWEKVVDTSKDTNSKEQNQWMKQAKSRRQRLTQEEKNRLAKQFYWQSIMPTSDIEQVILNDMQSTVNNILKEKSEDKEVLLAWLNLNTHYFVEIWAYIHYIVETVIWDKNNDWLIHNLWEVCTYQCRNNWKVNCYADE